MKEFIIAYGIVFLIWSIGVIISLACTCGIIWFALWSAKQFGIF